MTPHTASMSDSRAKFEAHYFWDTSLSSPSRDRRDDGRYWNADAERAWGFWQASRTAALEEAAEIAESFRSNDRAVNMTAQEIITTSVAESIATAIRIAGEGSKG